VFVSRISRDGRTDASILHADLDSFYASVEQRDDPALRGRPVAVGGGVILAASYEAKRYGVRTPMLEGQARELCPDLQIVGGRFEAYSEASRAVFEIFDDTTPLVEGLSPDEAFLDVGGLRRVSGSPVQIAGRLRARVRDEVGLPITVGVARTKFLAKVASGVGKPDGLLRVSPDRESEFLHPLPVEKLWGVGPKTAAKLNARGIRLVGDVAALPAEVVHAIVGGAMGHQVFALSQNCDPRRVEVGTRRGSIGSQQALGRRPRTLDEVSTIVRGIVDRITRRMRTAERVGRTVTLRLRFIDFERATRARTIAQATNSTEAIHRVAHQLLEEAWGELIEQRGISLVGVSVGNLGNADAVQLAFPFERSESTSLDETVDAIRDKFGSSSLSRVGGLGRGPAVSVPLLPD
jgi:DNA polymerase-4